MIQRTASSFSQMPQGILYNPPDATSTQSREFELHLYSSCRSIRTMRKERRLVQGVCVICKSDSSRNDRHYMETKRARSSSRHQVGHAPFVFILHEYDSVGISVGKSIDRRMSERIYVHAAFDVVCKLFGR